MTIQRAGFYLVALAAAVGWVVVYWHARQSDELEDPYAERVLTAKGFHLAAGPARLEPGLPSGTKPLSTIRGRVPFGPPASSDAPHGPGADNATASGPPPLDRDAPAPGSPCSIRPDDLSGGCRAEIVDLSGRPWARLYWDGAARLPGGRIVTRGPVLADTVEFTWTAPPAPRRTLVGIDAGLLAAQDGLGWEIGGRVYPRAWALVGRSAEARVGLYARGASVSGRVEGALGASLLFGAGR